MKERLHPKETEEEIIPVVRSFVVSLAPVEEIWREWQEKEVITPLRFYFGLKGEGSNLRLTLLGGKMRLGESLEEATQREVTEEGSFPLLGIPHQTVIDQREYEIPHREDLSPRRAIITYSPTLPPHEILIADPKVRRIVSLTFNEMRKLMEKGEIELNIGDQKVEVPLEEHLLLNPSIKGLVVTESDQELEFGLKWMEHIDKYLKGKFLQMIKDSPNEEEFRKRYDYLISHFMSQGLKVGIKFKIPKEIKARKNVPELSSSLNQGFLGRAVLFYLPFLVKRRNPLTWLKEETNASKVEFPGEVREFLSFWQSLFDSFLDTNGLSWKTLQLKLLGPQTLEEKIELINLLDRFIREALVSEGVTSREIDEALELSQTFLGNLSSGLRTFDDQMKGLLQDFAELNEVKNANLGYLLLLFLGLDIKENKIRQRLQYEAGRRLLLVLKALGWLRYYEENRQKLIQPGKAQLAINSFFGPVQEVVSIRIGEEDQKVEVRQWGKGQNGVRVVIDEKPLPKGPHSFLRKSFWELFERIFDFLSINVIFYSGPEDPGERIRLVQVLLEELFGYLREQYPTAQLKILKEDDYGMPAYIASLEQESREDSEYLYQGKRPGSQSNRFVRFKVVVELDGEKFELVIYPFLSLEDDRFMGWLEKIKDDPFYFVRRVVSGTNGIPSLYSLFYPPTIYPEHYLQKMTSRYHRD